MQVAATTAYKAEITQEENGFLSELKQEQAKLNKAIQDAGIPGGTDNSNGSNSSN